MKRKIISVLMAALLAFSAAGCGSTGGSSAGAEQGKDATPALTQSAEPEKKDEEGSTAGNAVTPEAGKEETGTTEPEKTAGTEDADAEAAVSPELSPEAEGDPAAAGQAEAAPRSAIPEELTLASPIYPVSVPCPNEEDYYGEDSAFDEEAYEAARDAWMEAVMKKQEEVDGLDRSGVFAFTSQLVPEVLGGIGEKNAAVSPVNIYMAMAMLAEISGGATRDQVLEVLGEESIESLRENVSKLWLAAYNDDATGTTILGDAVWLRNDSVYKEEALQQLADSYYASAYEGKMGDEAYNEALRTWINEQTHNLLTEQSSGLSFAPETVLALTSSIYFKGGWSYEFSKSNTQTDVFHATEGDVEVPYMKQTDDQTYYKGDKFGAICKAFNRGAMYFILPDEGVTPADVIADGQYMELFTDVETIPNQFLTIHVSVPRFDIASDLELSRNLRNLGAGLVFDAALSDFTSITNDPLFVSAVKHAARVKIDEEGCEAAAYTAIMMETTAFVEEMDEMDFVCDRPFIFVITGDWNLPLFVGVINNPNA